MKGDSFPLSEIVALDTALDLLDDVGTEETCSDRIREALMSETKAGIE